jgi:hypothetical protein
MSEGANGQHNPQAQSESTDWAGLRHQLQEIWYEEKRERLRGWYFRVRRCRQSAGFIAWCAKSEHLGDGPMDVPSNMECHFEFAATAEGALTRLQAEIMR